MVEYELMQRPRYSLAAALVAIGLLTAACATRVQPTTVLAPKEAPQVVFTAPAAPAPQPPDPFAELILLSTDHFEAGQRELTLGHLEQARSAFNQALEVLLESANGARFEPRIREHFDRLVERINAHELIALAQGDGFTEKKYDPASIDELLAVTTFPTPPPTAETEKAVAADMQETVHDIDIPLNAKVLSFVQLFTGRLKTYLEEGLGRGARYLPMIQSIFRAEGLPLDLAYVPLVESAFKQNALSRAKAKGMWQFMRGTALENGLKHDWYIDERAEPEKATRAAAKYLKSLYAMFGDWHLALASYNGGPGRVQRAIKRSGRPDFWKLTASTRYLPRETRDYVPLILAAVVIARNPAQYGLTIQPDAPSPEFEEVTLPTAVDLRRIAEWTASPIETIQNLNPELRRWTTPVRAADYTLKVPAGTVVTIRDRLAETDMSQLAPLSWHSVKKGETLATIARKLKVSRSDLAEANYLSIRSKVQPGGQLVIPRAPTLLQAARTENPPPVAESRPLETGVATVATVAVGPTAERSESTKLIYRVKRGDTLFSIARVFRTSVAALKSWNRLRTNAIKAGDRLTIFTTRANAD